METREVLPAEYDTLEQELEKALPFSIFVCISDLLYVIEKQWNLISCSILDAFNSLLLKFVDKFKKLLISRKLEMKDLVIEL